MSLWELVEIAELSPLGRALLALCIVEGFVIVHLWWVRQRDLEEWRKEATEIRKQLHDIIDDLLRRNGGGRGAS